MAPRFFSNCSKRRIIVRALKGYNLPEWVRISVGTMEQNRACIAALREVLSSIDRATSIWTPPAAKPSPPSPRPPGEGAIALIRISGQDAIAIADRVFRGKRKAVGVSLARPATGRNLRGRPRRRPGDALGPSRAASYTGEDLVEISCHGGILVTARVLEAVCARERARRVPGEFSERAFLNGKMDLTQAEAVMDLIRAQTDLALALRAPNNWKDARLRDQSIRDELIELLAHVEAVDRFSRRRHRAG